MTNPLPVPDLLVTFLLLTPGFLGLKMYLWRSRVVDQFKRFEKTAYSLILSGISLLLLYLGTSLLAGPIDPTNVTLDMLATAYFFQLIIAPLIGLILGEVVYNFDDHHKSRENIFNIFFDNLEADNHRKVKVRLENGREIQGFAVAWENTNTGQSVILKFPRLLFRNNQKSVKSDFKLGKYCHIKGDKIAEIYTNEKIVWNSREL